MSEAAPGQVAVGRPLNDARLSLGAAKLDDLFPEGEAYRRSVQTFSVLLVLAAFIASFGLFLDSVAAIIGAMVVAPLGGTIMAFAGALVTARNKWIVRTFVQVLLGSFVVIAVGILVSLVIPDPITLTPSLEARTSPGLLDLGVGLAAGAAGAYVTVRRTGTDALPGVAIAVSLVPPLATAGICLELGRIDDAAGALLLFLANFSAITVAACVVFALSGAVPDMALVRERGRVRNGVIVAVLAMMIVALPLVITGAERALETIRARQAAPVVRGWIGDRDLTILAWSLEGDRVAIVVRGPSAPDDPAVLAQDLATTLGVPIEVDLEYIPSTRGEVKAAP
jgi:uncharacterized hydrophobic protein (TIGR00271 family)